MAGFKGFSRTVKPSQVIPTITPGQVSGLKDQGRQVTEHEQGFIMLDGRKFKVVAEDSKPVGDQTPTADEQTPADHPVEQQFQERSNELMHFDPGDMGHNKDGSNELTDFR